MQPTGEQTGRDGDGAAAPAVAPGPFAALAPCPAPDPCDLCCAPLEGELVRPGAAWGEVHRPCFERWDREDEALEALGEAAAERLALAPRAAPPLLECAPPAVEVVDPVVERRRRIGELRAQGLGTKAIARLVGISTRQVQVAYRALAVDKSVDNPVDGTPSSSGNRSDVQDPPSRPPSFPTTYPQGFPEELRRVG